MCAAVSPQLYANESMSDHVGFARVFIELINENDNRPIFSKPLYNISLPENTPPGTSLLRILVSVANPWRSLGLQQLGMFEFASGSFDLPFLIDTFLMKATACKFIIQYAHWWNYVVGQVVKENILIGWQNPTSHQRPAMRTSSKLRKCRFVVAKLIIDLLF